MRPRTWAEKPEPARCLGLAGHQRRETTDVRHGLDDSRRFPLGIHKPLEVGDVRIHRVSHWRVWVQSLAQKRTERNVSHHKYVYPSHGSSLPLKVISTGDQGPYDPSVAWPPPGHPPRGPVSCLFFLGRFCLGTRPQSFECT